MSGLLGLATQGEKTKLRFENVINQRIDLEADIGSLGEEVDENVSIRLSSGGISLKPVDGRSRWREYFYGRQKTSECRTNGCEVFWCGSR